MSNPPNNPNESTPPNQPGSPWIYSGGDAGQGGGASSGYYAPPAAKPLPAATPDAPATPDAAQPSSASGPAAAAATPASRPPAVTPAAGASDSAAGNSDASLASIIDTIEAIIIALIIALTFRAVIVEAFVIPTGSMAPTLLGAHFKVICPKCGYEFDVETNLNKQVVMRDGRAVFPNNTDPLHQELRQNYLVANDGLPVYCPNCRNPILAADGAEKGFPQFLQNRQIGDFERLPLVWANNGDRILVLKYLYSVMEPHRWDVIVFKEPQEAKDNFIKRLIGLPGDTIEIVNGDIYVGKKGDLDPEKRFIQRKPEYIQTYLWQLVYDNDFYPIDENKPRSIPSDARRSDKRDFAWTNPWETDVRTSAGWKRDTNQGLGTTPTYMGNGPSALTFNIRPAYTQEAPYTLNTLGYNNDQYIFETNPEEFAPRSLVGDLRLETLWRPLVPDAAGISMTLGRPNNCYRITWNREGLVLDQLAPTKGQFQRIASALVGRAPGAPQQGKAYTLAFENVDHAVRFYIDGTQYISYEPSWNVVQARDDAAKYPPDWSVEELSRNAETARRANTRISIDIAGPCTLAHLKLLRDLYYTQVLAKPNILYPKTATEGEPLTLQDDEFFALGDNSRRSADGRLWGHVYAPLNDLSLRDGIVPRRYLLGKAFFVYWPAGFRASTTITGVKDLPIVPNTGDMRIIR
jgi:signal peptidase I